MRASIYFIIMIILLAACQTAPQTTEEPTQPTSAPTSAPTAASQPSETPESDPILFIDEFNGALQGGWEILNEDPLRWTITPEGWLEIQAANPGFLDQGEGIRQQNVFTRPAPEGDFVITAYLHAQPMENFQQAGILMSHDGENYVAIIDAICSFCLPDTGGTGIFMEGFLSGEFVTQGMVIEQPMEQSGYYLRLSYSAEEGTIAGEFASGPDAWMPIGEVSGVPEIQMVGIGAANAPSPEGVQEDLRAYIDYFEISTQRVPVRAVGSVPQPRPTATPTPTAEPTATSEPTPLPEGVLFRDDFNGSLQPGWEWINENPEKWAFVEDAGEGWLQITGDKPGGLAVQTNTLSRPLPEGDFEITTHVLADPRVNHHQANIFIFQDDDNYIRLNFGYCDHCGLPEGGHGFFMETIIENNPFGDFYAIPRDPEATDVYLRLVNQAGSITGYYATTFGEWIRIGAFGNFFDFVSVGLGATNSVPEDWEVEDIVAQFDYFELAVP